MAQLPEHFHPTAGDSAGQPWAGRSFEANPFADDDGTMPPAVREAFDAFGRGDATESEVVDALRGARVLIPLVAALGEAGENDAGVTVDKSAELSIVTVGGPDGRTVLPVFTSTDAMRAWNADARPVPAAFRTAAIAAADEATELVIVDPGATTQFGLRRPAVWAVAQDGAWTPAIAREDVLRALAAAIVDEPLARGIDVSPGAEPGSLEGPEIVVEVVVDPDASATAVRELLDRLGVRWSTDAGLTAAVDSLTVRVRPASPSAAPPNGTAARGEERPRSLWDRLRGR